jgi:hypothetical protein
MQTPDVTCDDGGDCNECHSTMTDTTVILSCGSGPGTFCMSEIDGASCGCKTDECNACSDFTNDAETNGFTTAAVDGFHYPGETIVIPEADVTAGWTCPEGGCKVTCTEDVQRGTPKYVVTGAANDCRTGMRAMWMDPELRVAKDAHSGFDDTECYTNGVMDMIDTEDHHSRLTASADCTVGHEDNTDYKILCEAKGGSMYWFDVKVSACGNVINIFDRDFGCMPATCTAETEAPQYSRFVSRWLGFLPSAIEVTIKPLDTPGVAGARGLYDATSNPTGLQPVDSTTGGTPSTACLAGLGISTASQMRRMSITEFYMIMGDQDAMCLPKARKTDEETPASAACWAITQADATNQTGCESLRLGSAVATCTVGQDGAVADQATCAGAVADQATCEAVETAATDDADAKACEWTDAVDTACTYHAAGKQFSRCEPEGGWDTFELSTYTCSQDCKDFYAELGCSVADFEFLKTQTLRSADGQGEDDGDFGFRAIHMFEQACDAGNNMCCNEEPLWCRDQCMPCYSAMMADAESMNGRAVAPGFMQGACRDDPDKKLQTMGVSCDQMAMAGCTAVLADMIPGMGGSYHYTCCLESDPTTCDESQCTSPGQDEGFDCYASMEEWQEPKTCAAGYVVTTEPPATVASLCPKTCGSAAGGCDVELNQCTPTVPVSNDPASVYRTDGGQCEDCQKCAGMEGCLASFMDPEFCGPAPAPSPPVDCSAEVAPFVNCAPLDSFDDSLDVSGCAGEDGAGVVSGGTCCVLCGTTGESTTYQCPHQNTDPTAQPSLPNACGGGVECDGQGDGPCYCDPCPACAEERQPECPDQCKLEFDTITSDGQLAALKGEFGGPNQDSTGCEEQPETCAGETTVEAAAAAGCTYTPTTFRIPGPDDTTNVDVAGTCAPATDAAAGTVCDWSTEVPSLIDMIFNHNSGSATGSKGPQGHAMIHSSVSCTMGNNLDTAYTARCEALGGVVMWQDASVTACGNTAIMNEVDYICMPDTTKTPTVCPPRALMYKERQLSKQMAGMLGLLPSTVEITLKLLPDGPSVPVTTPMFKETCMGGMMDAFTSGFLDKVIMPACGLGGFTPFNPTGFTCSAGCAAAFAGLNCDDQDWSTLVKFGKMFEPRLEWANNLRFVCENPEESPCCSDEAQWCLTECIPCGAYRTTPCGAPPPSPKRVAILAPPSRNARTEAEWPSAGVPHDPITRLDGGSCSECFPCSVYTGAPRSPCKATVASRFLTTGHGVATQPASRVPWTTMASPPALRRTRTPAPTTHPQHLTHRWTSAATRARSRRWCALLTR